MLQEVNAANFASEVTNSSTPVVVDFYTQNCGPCRAMAPVLAELATERAANLKIVKVDVEQNLQLASQFRVSAMPTFILFHGGVPQRQIVGARSKKLFAAWI